MLILASGSPRRKHLLETMGVDFRVIISEVEEINDHHHPRELVETNARLKTDWVADRHPGDWVLGSDTTVALGDEILNKPADMEEARSMLWRMGGRIHTVYTAVCLANRETRVSEMTTVLSQVAFKALDEALISRYFELVNPLDKAGAYGIQEGKELIIDHWKGSFSNIMGLPVDEVRNLLIRYELM